MPELAHKQGARNVWTACESGVVLTSVTVVPRLINEALRLSWGTESPTKFDVHHKLSECEYEKAKQVHGRRRTTCLEESAMVLTKTPALKALRICQTSVNRSLYQACTTAAFIDNAP